MDPTELSELLDQIGNADDPSEVVAELSADQLAAVRDELTETIRSLATAVRDGESENPGEDMETVAAARASLEAVGSRLSEIEEANAAQAAEADEVLAALEPEASDEDAESDDDSDEDAPDEPEADAEPVVEAEDEPADAEPVPEPVAASGRRRPVNLGRVAANRTRQPEPTPSSELVLTASAGIEDAGIRFGHRFQNRNELGRAMAESWRGLNPSGGGSKLQVAQANFADQVPYRVTDDAEQNFVMLDQIRRDAERGEAILASGGLCAPGTPVYDFFSVSARDDLLMLPPVTSERGSLIHPVSPGVADLLVEDGIATEWTDARDVAAAPTKEVFEPACVETRTCDIIAWATRLQFGNFQQVFYPEFVAHLTSEAMITHDHKVDIELIDDIAAFATLVQDQAGNVGGGTLVNLSHILGFAASWYRNKWRMSANAAIEVLLPAYVRDAGVADYIARNGTVDIDRARAAVDAVFTQQNLRVQWLANMNPHDFLPGASWPAANAILFAPGTIIRQTRATLNLGVVRDSTLNATNDFQTFEETFDSACLVGNEVISLTNINVCPTGATGEQTALTCFTGESS